MNNSLKTQRKKNKSQKNLFAFIIFKIENKNRNQQKKIQKAEMAKNGKTRWKTMICKSTFKIIYSSKNLRKHTTKWI